MDEFRIPLSEIINLAKTQACTYWLECDECLRNENLDRQKRVEIAKEKEYWNKVDIYLQDIYRKRYLK